MITGKIGVIGRSLGGIPSIHLASQYPELISLLVTDRTFGSTREVAANKLQGKRSSKLIYDFFTLNWRSANDENFLKVTCPKIVMIDPLDEIVYLFSTLPVLAAKKACENHFAGFRLFTESSLSLTLVHLQYLFDLEQILFLAGRKYRASTLHRETDK